MLLAFLVLEFRLDGDGLLPLGSSQLVEQQSSLRVHDLREKELDERVTGERGRKEWNRHREGTEREKQGHRIMWQRAVMEDAGKRDRDTVGGSERERGKRRRKESEKKW